MHVHTYTLTHTNPPLQIMEIFWGTISNVRNILKCVYGHSLFLKSCGLAEDLLSYLDQYYEGLQTKFKPLKPPLTYPQIKTHSCQELSF